MQRVGNMFTEYLLLINNFNYKTIKQLVYWNQKLYKSDYLHKSQGTYLCSMGEKDENFL